MTAIATATYPTYPNFDTQQLGESVNEYGMRALRFLLEHGALGLLDDNALDLALNVSTGVVAARDISGAALDRLHELRLRIMASLKSRQAEAAALARQVNNASSAPKPKDGGKPAMLRRPVPVVPPASMARRL